MSAEMSETEKPPKFLIVSTPKGGSGKSTAARHLAVAAALLDGLSVATVDLDSQKTLTNWFAVRPEKARQIRHFEASMSAVDDIGGMTGFDLVVVDTPPLTVSAVDAEDAELADADEIRVRKLRTLIGFADLVLVPCLQQHDDILSTVPWLHMLRAQGVKYASLLSATNRRALSFEEARRSLCAAGPLCPIDIPRLEDVALAMKQGLTVTEVRKAKGADDWRAVWGYTKTQLGFQA